MGIFLAYLLAVVCTALAFVPLREIAGESHAANVTLTWFQALVFLAYAAGLLAYVWKHVRPW